jgi:hypothetical protein
VEKTWGSAFKKVVIAMEYPASEIGETDEQSAPPGARPASRPGQAARNGAPLIDQRICWHFDNRRLIRWFMTDSAAAVEIRLPARRSLW